MRMALLTSSAQNCKTNGSCDQLELDQMGNYSLLTVGRGLSKRPLARMKKLSLNGQALKFKVVFVVGVRTNSINFYKVGMKTKYASYTVFSLKKYL